ncbi:MAG TPA: cytochrome P450 [Thermomonospora sp.]|nr:cytochrome P450 [Thermomonospora sp.]
MKLRTDALQATRILAQRAALLAGRAAGDLGARLLTDHADPHALYEEVRARGPLVRTRLGLYLTASHTVADRLLRHPAMGMTARPGMAPPDPHGPVDPLAESFGVLDGPEHRRLRRPAALGFRPADLAARAPRIAALASELLDAVPEDRPFDLATDFAAPLPLLVISDLLGLEPDIPAFRRWSKAEVAVVAGPRTPGDARRWRRTVQEAEGLFRATYHDRRARPRDDLLGRMANADPPLTEREFVATAEMVFFAGYDTTPWLIGNTVLAVLDHPDRDAALAEDGLVEEVLRYDPPVQYTARTALERIDLDTEQGAVTVPEGATVLLLLAAAGRDPAVFPDPGRFDPARPNARDHLAFAPGPHHCVGAGLATLEATVAVRTLFDRFPGLHATGRPSQMPLPGLRAPASVPVAA